MSKNKDEKMKNFWRLTIILGSIFNLIIGVVLLYTCTVKVLVILGIVLLIEALVQLILLLIFKQFKGLFAGIIIIFNLATALISVFELIEFSQKEHEKEKTNKEISELKEEVKKLNKQLEDKK